MTAAAVYLVAILCVFGDTVLSRTRVLSKDGENLATIFLYWEQFDAAALRAGDDERCDRGPPRQRRRRLINRHSRLE